jgi:lipopolysaccharide transport system ATP-binding protein
LGMTKKEIQSKFDEIVDFSGCELYIDTPTKRYSSGMTVRLGFAVAAFLDPEILVVDEVLAVGDAEFQKKAIGKMKEISHGSGRTVLFVSHNMGSMKALCSTALLLQNGTVVKSGQVGEVVETYLDVYKINKVTDFTPNYNSAVYFNKIKEVLYVEGILTFKVELFCSEPKTSIDVGLSIHDRTGEIITYYYTSWDGRFLQSDKGLNEYNIRIDNLNLTSDTYLIKGRILVGGIEVDWPKEYLTTVSIDSSDFYKTGIVPSINTKLLMRASWE